MSKYLECPQHGYYDVDNGCPECDAANDARIRQEERERCLRIFEARTRHVWDDCDLTMETLREALNNPNE